ncbi:MAG: PilN domain-containing protein [Armatimonadetes bacterium]|nr:PilN domain-containing protein [Armatimonadota bacterium]
MRKRRTESSQVLEWSSGFLRVFDPLDGTMHSGNRIGDILNYVRGEPIVAVSRKHVFTRSLRLPDLPKSEARKILMLRLTDIFPLPAGDLAFDFHFLDDRDEDGRMAVVAAIPKSLYRDILADLKVAGITPYCLVPTSLGTVLNERAAKEHATILVDSTDDSVGIDVLVNGALKSSKLLPATMADVLPEELSKVQALTSGLNPVMYTTSQQPHSLPSELTQSPLETLSKANVDFALEPIEEVAKREAAESNRLTRTTAFLWIATFLLGAVIWDQRSRDSALVQKDTTKMNKRVEIATATLDQAKTALATLTSQKQVLDLGFAPKQPISDVAMIMANLTPSSIWLTGLSIERGKEAQIRGTSTQPNGVTAFVKNLSGQRRFRDVRLIFANNSDQGGTPVIQFALSAHVVGNLPMNPEVAKK